MTVERVHGAFVAANIGAGEGKSGKQAFGAQVGEDLGIQFPVGVGSGMTTNRSGHDLMRRQRCIVEPILHFFESLRPGSACYAQTEQCH